MKTYLLLLIATGLMIGCNNAKTDEMAKEATTEVAVIPPVEIGDQALVEKGKASLAAFAAKDMTGFTAIFADNIMYRWNYGDSLVGKQAVMDYYGNRMKETIKTISFQNDIWLPVKVNTPSSVVQAPGHWLLSWYMVTATYSTGKTMNQWIHTDWHFNDAGLVDTSIQYIDRASIMAASTK